MHKIKSILLFILFGVIFSFSFRLHATPLSDWELNEDGYFYYVGSLTPDGYFHLISIPTKYESEELEYFKFETKTWEVVTPIDPETNKGSNFVYMSYYDGGPYALLKISTSNSNTELLTEALNELLVRKLRFKSPDTLSPVINGETNFITNVDNPISEASIKEGLHAFDNVDGYLDSSHFILVSDNYTENKHILGTYVIRYKVSDTAGNPSYVNVNVKVVDVTKPIITGTNEYQLRYNEILDINTISNNLTVTDNYDTVINPLIISNTYSGNEAIVGEWLITYEATDSSGNKSNLFTVIINVIDNIKPVISGPDTYNTGTKTKLLETNIRNQITATDEYDGMLELQLIYDNYTENYNQIGTYFIKYKAVDSSNNFMEFLVTINVTDDSAPNIYTNRFFINIDGALNYTLEQIIDHLIQTGQITAETMKQYNIESSNYYQAPGEYEVILTKQASAPSELAENIVIKIKVFEQNQHIDPSDNNFNYEQKKPVVLIVIVLVIIGLSSVSIMLGITMKRRKKFNNR